MGVIIRNDDLNFNANYPDVQDMYLTMKIHIPDVEIWSAVSIISGDSKKGAIDDDLPLSEHPREWFYTNSKHIEVPRLLHSGYYGKIISHGLLHFDHRHLDYRMQEMSIVTSCSLLNSKTFVPPFNGYNESTEEVCNKYGIELIRMKDGWKSLESEPFDPSHNKWYFHSWRFTPKTFKEKFIHELSRA